MATRVRADGRSAPRPPELAEIEQCLADGGDGLSHRVACEVTVRGQRLPVHVIALGNPSPQVPAVGVFGGVHGLERIGAEVAISFLRQVVARLRWDRTLRHLLQGLRLVFMPLVNPGGLMLGTRANPQGVDLMRNAPVDGLGAPPLLGGQRISPSLPWYRGPAGGPMEPEARALCEVVEAELATHAFALAIDCHSGFGLADRLWFPYAHTARPIEHLAELDALSALLDEALLHHRYVIEPQSRQYLAQGDLWDHLLLRSLGRDPGRVLLPLTLEMGSWLWVKKNPRQFFSRHGLFNPSIAHRQQRVLRRHVQLLDLLLRAAFAHEAWRPQGEDRERARARALRRWYGEERGQ